MVGDMRKVLRVAAALLLVAICLYATTYTINQAVTVSGLFTASGHTVFEGVTSTGAAGTGKIMYDTGSTPTSLNCTNCTAIPAAAITGTNTLPTGTLPIGTPILLSEHITSGTDASVTFSSISASYRNLTLMLQARCDNSSTDQGIGVTFNNDTGGNYERQYINANQAVLTAAQLTAQNSMVIADISCATALANTASVNIISVPNYTGTTFHKQAFTANSGVNGTVTSNLSIFIFAGRWASTAAINRIDLTPSAGNFITGSTFDLYAQ